MSARRTDGGTTIGYEVELWTMADKLRGSTDASSWKHVALGLVFLECFFAAFEERRAAVLAEVERPNRRPA